MKAHNKRKLTNLFYNKYFDNSKNNMQINTDNDKYPLYYLLFSDKEIFDSLIKTVVNNINIFVRNIILIKEYAIFNMSAKSNPVFTSYYLFKYRPNRRDSIQYSDTFYFKEYFERELLKKENKSFFQSKISEEILNDYKDFLKEINIIINEKNFFDTLYHFLKKIPTKIKVSVGYSDKEQQPEQIAKVNGSLKIKKDIVFSHYKVDLIYFSIPIGGENIQLSKIINYYIRKYNMSEREIYIMKRLLKQIWVHRKFTFQLDSIINKDFENLSKKFNINAHYVYSSIIDESKLFIFLDPEEIKNILSNNIKEGHLIDFVINWYKTVLKRTIDLKTSYIKEISKIIANKEQDKFIEYIEKYFKRNNSLKNIKL